MTRDLTRETLESLEEGIAASERHGEPENEASWGYEYGVLLTRREAQGAAECVREVAALRRQVEVWQAECASMSEEFGLPPTIRPAEGEIRRLMDERKALKSENATLRAKAEIVDAMERGEIAAFSYRKDGRVALYTPRCLREYEDEPIVAPTLVEAYAQARAAQGRMASEMTPLPDFEAATRQAEWWLKRDSWPEQQNIARAYLALRDGKRDVLFGGYTPDGQRPIGIDRIALFAFGFFAGALTGVLYL